MTGLFNKEEIRNINRTEKEYLAEANEVLKARHGHVKEVKNSSGIPLNLVYTPADISEMDYLNDLSFPGKYPYTRSPFPGGYRTRAWNMRQVFGYGTAEEANERLKFLISQGQTGIFLPEGTAARCIGSDDELATGYWGHNLAWYESVADYETVLQGIDLNKYICHISADSPERLAMFVAAAEKLGYNRRDLKGGLSNKPSTFGLPENEGNPTLDIIEFCIKEMPQYNCIYISARNLAEGGFTPVQELAVAMAWGMDAIRLGLRRGLDVDSLASKTAFYMNSGSDFFAEIAKFRASRRMWSRIVREKFGAKNPSSWVTRTHVQTSGVPLTRQQPLNNLCRSTLHALPAVLAGIQSLHICSYDEATTTPMEGAQTLSLRIAQIIECETGIPDVIDALGGSYYIEWLTNKTEEEAQKIIDEIEQRGGFSKAVNWLWLQQQQSALKYQKQIESGERRVVGVNVFTMSEEEEKAILPIIRTSREDELHKKQRTGEFHEKQKERTRRFLAQRDNAKAELAKKMLYDAYKAKVNIVPPLIEAAKAGLITAEINQVRQAAIGKTVFDARALEKDMEAACAILLYWGGGG